MWYGSYFKVYKYHYIPVPIADINVYLLWCFWDKDKNLMHNGCLSSIFSAAQIPRENFAIQWLSLHKTAQIISQMTGVPSGAIYVKFACVFELINRENASQKKTWCEEQRHTREIFEHAISLMWPLTGFIILPNTQREFHLEKSYLLYIYTKLVHGFAIYWYANALRVNFSNLFPVWTTQNEKQTRHIFTQSISSAICTVIKCRV